MKALLALGANLGERGRTLNEAARHIDALANTTVTATSSIYRSPPLLPSDAPEDWYNIYYNAALAIETTLTPTDLLSATQGIEASLGRVKGDRWAPRLIDIDIVTYGELELESKELTLPHREAIKRDFVLAPLCDIAPGQVLQGRTVLDWKRSLSTQLPAWMKIINVTPDSFSGDGLLAYDADGTWDPDSAEPPNYIDIGAESTRPNADPVLPEQEWNRLRPIVERLDLASYFRPKVSIDTRHPETARRAIDAGVDLINDVSALSDPEMLEVLQGADCDVAIMHNMGIPANPSVTLSCEDPVIAVKEVLAQKLAQLDQAGIGNDRVHIDPGIGFGKRAEQSWTLLQRIEELMDLNTRILVGHSRKSFLKTITQQNAGQRDPHTLAISLYLADKGVDTIRVHNLSLHHNVQDARWRLA